MTIIKDGQEVQVLNLKSELEHADHEQRETSWQIIDVVLNEGGPNADIEDVFQVLEVLFPPGHYEVWEYSMLKQYAGAVRTWLEVQNNAGMLYQAIDAIMETAPVYDPGDDVMGALVPQPYFTTAPRQVRTLASGYQYEVYSEYEQRIALARWSASRNTPGLPNFSLSSQEKQEKAAELEEAMLDLGKVPVDPQDPNSELANVFIDKETSKPVQTVKAMKQDNKTAAARLASFVFLERLLKAHAGRYGIPGWQDQMHEPEKYAIFPPRFDKAKALFRRSKASVLNLFKADYYHATFAMNPHHALGQKRGNITNNEGKANLLQAGQRVLGKNRQNPALAVTGGVNGQSQGPSHLKSPSAASGNPTLAPTAPAKRSRRGRQSRAVSDSGVSLSLASSAQGSSDHPDGAKQVAHPASDPSQDSSAGLVDRESSLEAQGDVGVQNSPLHSSPPLLPAYPEDTQNNVSGQQLPGTIVDTPRPEIPTPTYDPTYTADGTPAQYFPQSPQGVYYPPQYMYPGQPSYEGHSQEYTDGNAGNQAYGEQYSQAPIYQPSNEGLGQEHTHAYESNEPYNQYYNQQHSQTPYMDLPNPVGNQPPILDPGLSQPVVENTVPGVDMSVIDPEILKSPKSPGKRSSDDSGSEASAKKRRRK